MHLFFPCSAAKSRLWRTVDCLPTKERTFGTWDMVALWIGLVVCIPSWFLATSLVEMGACACKPWKPIFRGRGCHSEGCSIFAAL